MPEILQDGTNTYVYGLGRISSTNGSGVQTYYDADGLGSTSDLTNGSATKADGYTYDAFGTATHSPGSSTQPFQFTGQQTDADSGLQYLRARYYDPATGRFLSRDPAPSANRYAYGSNNPTSMTDPNGQWPSVPDPSRVVSGATNGITDVGRGVYNGVVDAANAVAPYAQKCAAYGFTIGLATVNPIAGAGACAIGASGAGNDIWSFAKRFGTLNCLSAGLGLAGLAASFYLGPEVFQGEQLAYAWLAQANFYAAGTLVSGLQIGKEGNAFSLNGVTAGVDLSGFIVSLGVLTQDLGHAGS